jgi:hypothetical protein
MKHFDGEWDYCDRCGKRELKVKLIKQSGLEVCKKCYDKPSYKECDEQ